MASETTGVVTEGVEDAATTTPMVPPQQMAEEDLTRDAALAAFATIDWSSYGRVGLLSATEVDAIKQGEDAPMDYTLKDGVRAPRYAKTLLKVVATVQDAPAVRYALTRMEDVLLADDCGLSLAARVAFFVDGATFDASPFLRLLGGGPTDGYATRVGASVLATFLTVREETSPEPFVAWLCDQLSASRDSGNLRAAAPALTILLRQPASRKVFVVHGGVGYATKLLKARASKKTNSNSSSAQTIYELTFCLWTLSLEWSSNERVVSDFLQHNAVEILADQIKAAPREKVVRVSLATLRNLCSSGQTLSSTEGVASRMIKAGLPKTLRTLRERPFGDPDLRDDLDALSKTLAFNYRELSTFERYVAEVDGGDLQWASLCHSEQFWKENAKLCEREDFAVVKKLVTYLTLPVDDPDSYANVAIACSDLGEFVRFYPNGKAVIKHLGAKDHVMTLVSHPDPDVQRHALQCVSKLLVTNWQFLNSSSKSGDINTAKAVKA